jgi:hypothetical protein
VGRAVSNLRRLPDGLPWHVRVYDHVYIWAGGDYVRRLHFIQFQQLSQGLPVSGQLLQAGYWKYREAFEDACVQHEKGQTQRLILPPRMAIR